MYLRKTNFFPTQAIAKTIFHLHSTYAEDTPHQVWIDLNNTLTRRKGPIFKIRYSRNSKISV